MKYQNSNCIFHSIVQELSRRKGAMKRFEEEVNE